ncbi:MAG: ribonuclease P protein component [Parvicella sp.]
MKNTLNKNERLKAENDIKKVFRSKSRFISFPIRVNYDVWEHKQGDAPVVVLIGCSKKGVKSAVNRIRIKRLIREVYRTNKSELYNYSLTNNKKLGLSLIYIGTEIPDFEFIELKIKEVLTRLLSQLNNTDIDEII